MTKKLLVFIGILLVTLALFISVKYLKKQPKEIHKSRVVVKKINNRGDKRIIIDNEKIDIESGLTNHKVNISVTDEIGKIGYNYEIFHLWNLNMNIGVNQVGPFINFGYSITPGLSVTYGTSGPGFNLRL